MKLEIDGKTYQFEFGLLGLIYIRDNPYKRENLTDILWYGLHRQHPYLTSEDISVLSQYVNNDSAIHQYCKNSPFLSQAEVAEYYRQMVGEVGIQPSDFYQMTLQEIDMTYDGYITRRETDINLLLLALKTKKTEINLRSEKKYSIGSNEEREQVFQALGIKEEKE